MSDLINGVDVEPAKNEINFTMLYMHLGAIVIGALIVVLYSQRIEPDSIEHGRLSIALFISLAGLIAQGDYKIARLSHWIVYLNNFRSSVVREVPVEWEDRKRSLWSRWMMMPFADLAALAAPLYAAGNTLVPMYESDPTAFQVGGVILGLVIASIFVGQREW